MDSVLDAGRPSAPPSSSSSREPEEERLRHLLAACQTFVGHDLPNQLVCIQAFSQQLDGAEAGSEESSVLLRRIGALSQKLGVQARRLFDINALLLEPPWGPPVSLREVAEEVVANVRCRTDAGRIDFHLPEPAIDFPLAEKLLHRVLLELVANAVAAIGPGRVGRIDVTGWWSEGGGTIRVTDDGVGIAPDRLERLRLPLEGGLLLVHQAAASWGGRVDVAPGAGGGTAVAVTTGGRT